MRYMRCCGPFEERLFRYSTIQEEKKKIDDNNNLKNAVLASKQIDEKSLNILVRNDNNYDSKRDRWFGYKGKDYAKVLERYTQNLNTENNSDVGTDLDTDEECELMLLGLTPQDISIYLQNKDKNQDDNKTYTSVRLREDKAVYLTIGEDGEEGVTKYDPKSRLYKDETKGVINTKNNFYYRNVDGEGLEFTKLQNKLKLIQQEEGTANTSGTAPNGDTRWKNNRRKNFDHNIQEKVLIANPTKYEYLLSKKNKDDDKKQKRDLKYYEAVRPTSEPNGSDQKQLIDKVIDKYK
ncbi:mRNA splicing protein SLU7 SCDLUD_001653 [Saccharomycodes ludwigii]|uniref:mRNA splicing protein SLU7 n=1 Tax=Saccharomycodes ludwigii TaxID=36035 RepID=UPI001E89D6BD|nr:hypothetical protein SCDLUD_001653 [Saccharomycodes ludwigii]KAH3901869.1 hypothetical protein SCDLUD_001653 [Saccharomycodes ludwigii]